ncbi:MAG: tRNA (adenine-N1)-methyltransferase [Nitrosopumilus sp.]|nr:tRNA (adenine-N1)-methyltransferase [Nitrosopumilus sp.]MDH3385775.1 tRNA (adenine-N1)-methyltransferase [Nitrosopumilus sp.]
MELIKQNSPVLFFFNSSKKWLVKISKKEALHTHIGILKHVDAIGKEYGSKITTNKDKYVYLLKPTMYDYIMKIQHGTQIVYPKDLGYIVARAGIQNNQKVVEIGTGSASLTSFVASIVKPRGHVYTFDVDENFMKIAAKNLKKCGMEKYVTQQNLDIKTIKKPPVTDADVVLIDLGDPWTVIPQVRQMLKGSGAIFAICPTMNQLEKLTMSLIENEFTDIESTEHILRTIEAREGKTRHSFQGIGHTTYLCFARKAFFNRDSKKKSAPKSKKISETAKKSISKKEKTKILKSNKKQDLSL